MKTIPIETELLELIVWFLEGPKTGTGRRPGPNDLLTDLMETLNEMHEVLKKMSGAMDECPNLDDCAKAFDHTNSRFFRYYEIQARMQQKEQVMAAYLAGKIKQALQEHTPPVPPTHGERPT